MNMEAVILLVGIDHRPLFRIAELDGLVDARLVDDAAVDHEHLAVGGARINQRPPPRDRRSANVIDPLRTGRPLAQNFVLDSAALGDDPLEAMTANGSTGSGGRQASF